jgi:hypothetical protein
MATQDFSFPNGIVVAYYGNATSCRKQVLDKNDYAFALTRADGALWALSPQSGTVFAVSPQDYISGAAGQAYRGYYGNE